MAPSGLWPIQSVRWWPQPRADGAAPNAAWHISRCDRCGLYSAQLHALSHVLPGAELRVEPSSTFLSAVSRSPNFLATFDGGAKLVRGQQVAGAGAILWGPRDDLGSRHRLADASVALPGERFAQVAEAWGLRLAGGLLLSNASCVDVARTVLVAGDNLAVVRYGAAQGRLHRPEMQGILESILESILAKLPAAGWSISWLAMRRCFNGAADKLATAALNVASVLAQAGKMAPCLL